MSELRIPTNNMTMRWKICWDSGLLSTHCTSPPPPSREHGQTGILVSFVAEKFWCSGHIRSLRFIILHLWIKMLIFLKTAVMCSRVSWLWSAMSFIFKGNISHNNEIMTNPTLECQTNRNNIFYNTQHITMKYCTVCLLPDSRGESCRAAQLPAQCLSPKLYGASELLSLVSLFIKTEIFRILTAKTYWCLTSLISLCQLRD